MIWDFPPFHKGRQKNEISLLAAGIKFHGAGGICIIRKIENINIFLLEICIIRKIENINRETLT